jgi:hypothetical protein
MDPHWDLSSRLSHRLGRTTTKDVSTFDERFIWNEYIIRGLLGFRSKLDEKERADLDHCQFLVCAKLSRRFAVELIAVDSGHPRLRRDAQHCSSGTTDERITGGCDVDGHLSLREEPCRNAVQYQRCRR